MQPFSFKEFLKRLYRGASLGLALALGGGVGSYVAVTGQFRARICDPDGRVVDDWAIANGATTAGLNYVLDTAFRNQTQKASWYIGLINNSGFSGLSAADTSASHSGWTELTNYSESVRQQWSPAAAASGQLTITTPVVFTINTTSVTIAGIFLASSSTKSSTTDTIWATAQDGSPKTVTNGQTFQVYYTTTFTPVS